MECKYNSRIRKKKENLNRQSVKIFNEMWEKSIISKMKNIIKQAKEGNLIRPRTT